MTEQELLDMKLHEERQDGRSWLIKRVIGGWLYTITSNVSINITFVPEPPKPDVIIKVKEEVESE